MADTVTVGGEVRWVLPNAGGGFDLFRTREERDRVAEIERRNAEGRAAAAARVSEAREREEAACADEAPSPFGRFIASLSPMAGGRARSTLMRTVRYRGEIVRRREIVERAIAGGAVVSEVGIEWPDRTFLDAQNITATGIEYARYLSR